ncbi:MAG: hypothetical protein KF745_14115 [Phycisphaeraceae bacterium]|nr:hypothetical protein [Phycisphaeraceae bacterium]
MKTRVCMGAASLMFAAGAMAGVPDVDVLYSRVGATSAIPGAQENDGSPAATAWNTMLEFWLSPDGSKWLLKGTSTQATTADNLLMLGSGGAGSVILQDGRPFPGAVGGEIVDFISTSNMYPFNQNNEWAIALRARGGVASVFQKVLRFSSADVGELRFQMGDLYTGMVDNPVGSSGDEILGNSVGTVHLLNDGRIGTHDTTIGNISTTRRPGLAYDKVKYLQARLDSVTPITGVGSILITDIASTGTISLFWTSPDGTRTVVRARPDQDGNGTNIPADPDAVVVDGQVRLQVGQTIPGDTISVTGINQTSVASNNDWYARGAYSGGAFAVRNGTVIAKTGDPIGGGSNWGGTFLTISGNSNGDYVIAGKSDNADPAFDDVIVVNGEVVLREGDPVSVNGDTVYIGRANTALAAFSGSGSNIIGIAPDKTVYVIAQLRTEAAGGADYNGGSGTPYSLIRINVGTCPADFDGNGTVDPTDIATFINAWFNSLNNPPDLAGDFDGNGIIEPADIATFINAWFDAVSNGC